MESPSDLSVEQRQVIDQLADEFEAALRTGQRPSIENVLAANPALRPHLLTELIAIEIELRRAAGELATLEEYKKRFPNDRPVVEAVFYPATDMASTADQSRDTEVEEDEPQPERLDRYLIQRQLGRGGFGTVYLAYDPQLDRPVALKIPRRKRFKTPQQVASFMEEARTAAKLKHVGLVGVYDVREERGLPYIVQEYIDGINLSQWAAKQQPSFEHIAQVLLGITDAIGYAHQQGLTHCDLKLANVLIDTAGQPHVADFGLAVHEGTQGVRKGEVFGTPAMMAPEQVRGEGHRLDGRTDIWAIGVMLYELLVGRRPFKGSTQQDLFNEILTLDPRPLRQIDISVPRELERICLKCLCKKRTERYNTIDDLREDLHVWLDHDASNRVPQTSTVAAASDTVSPKPDSSSGSKPPAKIIPKGLRSFDADDADFFLDLLPGPRDRDGLPESIRFWKKRIEEPDPDKTFSVGLIYGPSGCGKSSLVKAGLLPRLAENVLPIYVEATATDTEVRILKQLRKHIPQLPSDASLVDACAELRLTGAGRHRKLLLVIDQFEQWLHSHAELKQAQLVDALRQCEGARLQAVLLVRDDFFVSVHRLFQELEQSLIDGSNYALIDRFDKEHSRRVLVGFGRAYNKFGDTLNSAEQSFVTRAVDELSEDGKVISVRLSLFADMMKSRPWVPGSLQEVGGIAGVGITFLEETFSVKSAPPAHRVHEQAIRKILRLLLPEAGTDIKGGMRSEAILRQAAGFQDDHKRFNELIRILDAELRIITPTEPDGGKFEAGGEKFENGSSNFAIPTSHFYQLTHDYLVPSVREWLTRKQRETRKGRAELKLEERTSLWSAKQENRFLPSFIEWINIRCLTSPKSWTDLQRTVMRKAARLHLTLWGSVVTVLLLVGIGIQQYLARENQKLLLSKRYTAVQNVQVNEGKAIPVMLDVLETLPRKMILDELRARFAKAEGQQKLSLAYGLARFGQVEFETIVQGVINKDTQGAEVANIVNALQNSPSHKDSSAQAWTKIQSAAQSATAQKDWKTKARLAIVAMYLGEMSIAEEMLRAEPVAASPQELHNPLDKLRDELAAFERLSTQEQNKPQVRLSRARACYYLDRPQDALKDLDLVLAQKRVPIDALHFQALCFAREGSAEKADKSVKRLALATKNSSYAEIAKIVTQAWLGNLEEANRQLEKFAKDNVNSTEQYNAACVAAQLVLVYGESNRTESDRLTKRAVDLLRQAYTLGCTFGIENDPDLVPLYGDAEFKELVLKVTQTWDPVQRTEFIAEFPEFCSDIRQLAERIERTNNPALRSGISLAVGSFGSADNEAKNVWRKIFENWFANESDSGVHSATDWAMRQWGYKPPTIEHTPKPSNEKAWWHTPLNLTMVKIPAGSVRGTNDLAGLIVVKQSFWLSDREISIELFKQFMAEAKDKLDDWKGAKTFENKIDDTHPVQNVSWEDAILFCNWLSEKHGLDKYYQIEPLPNPRKEGSHTLQRFNVKLLRTDGFRLPTAEEWEYSCRAKTTTAFSSGDEEERLKKYALFKASKTNPCGSKLSNPWGLYDMHGNVAERCWDARNSKRVVCGSDCSMSAKDCKSSYKSSFETEPAVRSDYILGRHIGFRVAQGPVGSQVSIGAESVGPGKAEPRRAVP